MGIFTKLFGSYFTSKNFASITQEQKAAFINILVTAMAIDGEVQQQERDELAKELKAIGWSGEYALETYIEQAVKNSSILSQDREMLRGHLLQQAGLMPEQWLREEAYYIAARIVCSDRQVQPQEHTFLQVLVETLALPSERQSFITQKLIQEGLV
jgi:uncharacterized membrane protein YebE (DUF533 family)